MAAAAARCRRAPEDARAGAGLIGPNAILQLLPVIAGDDGQAGLDRVLATAAIARLPDGTCMIADVEAARLHRALRRADPDRAPGLLAEAGRRTADYILAHRIPRGAQLVLGALPPPLAARLLARAIARHAWTFAGSGRFTVCDAWQFEIADNPLVRGERADGPLCAWHAAVFERLYQVLVAPDARCIETACCGQHGQDACRFVLSRTGPQRHLP